VLVIDTDPVMPTDNVVRGTLETLAANLARPALKVDRTSPLLPDFAASSRLYMRMLMSFLAAPFRRSLCRRTGRRGRAAGRRQQPRRRAPARHRAEPPRLADGRWRTSRLRAQWRELFKTYDAVICPIMPTPAYPHDHSEDQEKRRIRIDGKDYVYPDQLSWPGIATLPGLPPPRSRPALRRTDCRSACRSSAPGWKTARP
jgi:amidase